MKEHKLFTQRIGLIGLTNLITGLSGIILLPILTRTLSIEEYGIWIEMSITIGLIPVIISLGLPEAMVRFLASEKKRENVQDDFYSIIFIIFIISVLAAILIYIFSELLAKILFDDNLIIAKALAFIVFIECLNNVLINYFRTFQQIKKYSLLLFIRTYLTFVLVAYFVLYGYGILGAAIGLMISSIIVFSIQAYLIISEMGVKIPSFSHISEYLSFGLPILPGFLSYWMINSSDRYVISILMGNNFVGYYSPGYALGNMVYMLIGPLVFMLPATLSKCYDENNLIATKTALSYSLKYFLLLAIPSVFGLSLLSKPLLIILSTPEIAIQGYMITPLIAMSSLLYGSCVVISQILALEKKMRIMGAIWSIAALLNLILNFIFIPYLGILGAAITTLIAFSVAFILITYHSFKCFSFYIESHFILKSIAASIIMSLVIIKWTPADIFQVLLIIGVCVAIYILTLLLIGGIGKNEVNFFRDLLFTNRHA